MATFPATPGSPRPTYEGTQRFSDLLDNAMAKHQASEPPRRGLDTPMRQVRDQVTDAHAKIASVPGIAADHATAIEAIAASKQLTPDARRQQIAAKAGQGIAAMNDTLGDARGQLDDAQTTAHAAALPSIEPGNEALARQDAQMRLNAVAPAQRAELMQELAGRGDDIAGLVASPWGADYLASSGLSAKEVATGHQRVVSSALDAAASDDKPAAAWASHAGALARTADTEAPGVVRHFAADVSRRHGVSPQQPS